MSLTLESLIAAVRKAQSLDDLRDLHHLVGPSTDENLQAQSRLAELDRLDAHCLWSELFPPTEAARLARERYQRVTEEQGRFENRYC